MKHRHYRQDIKTRRSSTRLEWKHRLVNYFKQAITTPSTIKIRLEHQLFKRRLFKRASRVTARNFCRISFRGRSVYRNYGISRSIFKEKIHQGRITGMRKASWLSLINTV